MCNYDKIVHTCGHVQPGNIWYCSASDSRQNHIFRRCCNDSVPNSDLITSTADRLCFRCNRLEIRAREQWRDRQSPVCFTSSGRYTVVPSRLAKWDHMGVWLRYHGFSSLGAYFARMGFTLQEDIAIDSTRWHEDGFATPTWQLEYPDLAEVYPVKPGPFAVDVDLLEEFRGM